MSKAKLGTKRSCPACETRYYDMCKTPPECPQCGEVNHLDNAAFLAAASSDMAAHLSLDNSTGTEAGHATNEDLNVITKLSSGEEYLAHDEYDDDYAIKETDAEGNNYLENFSELEDIESGDITQDIYIPSKKYDA